MNMQALAELNAARERDEEDEEDNELSAAK